VHVDISSLEVKGWQLLGIVLHSANEQIQWMNRVNSRNGCAWHHKHTVHITITHIIVLKQCYHHPEPGAGAILLCYLSDTTFITVITLTYKSNNCLHELLSCYAQHSDSLHSWGHDYVLPACISNLHNSLLSLGHSLILYSIEMIEMMSLCHPAMFLCAFVTYITKILCVTVLYCKNNLYTDASYLSESLSPGI